MKMTKVKLGDILEAKRGTSLSGEYYDTKGKYIRLTLGNFNYPGGGFKENNIKKDIYFTGPIKKEFILHKGDIITPLTEQVAGLLGETARIPESDKFIQSADVALLIPNEKYLDKDYMYSILIKFIKGEPVTDEEFTYTQQFLIGIVNILQKHMSYPINTLVKSYVLSRLAYFVREPKKEI